MKLILLCCLLAAAMSGCGKVQAQQIGGGDPTHTTLGCDASENNCGTITLSASTKQFFALQLPKEEVKPGECLKVGPKVAGISELTKITCPVEEKSSEQGYCVSDTEEFSAYGPSNGECRKGFHYQRIEPGHGSSLPAVPFDVKPSETWIPPIPEKFAIGVEGCESQMSGVKDEICLADGPHALVLACADKTRFLLMSADSKWHCLKLDSVR